MYANLILTHIVMTHFHITLMSNFACELLVSSPYANFLRLASVRMWTGNDEFESEMRNPRVVNHWAYDKCN